MDEAGEVVEGLRAGREPLVKEVEQLAVRVGEGLQPGGELVELILGEDDAGGLDIGDFGAGIDQVVEAAGGNFAEQFAGHGHAGDAGDDGLHRGADDGSQGVLAASGPGTNLLDDGPGHAEGLRQEGEC